MSMHFQGAIIHGGEFRATNQTIQNGIQALSQAISHGAMHDSAERDPPPRCHPGTREKATKDIIQWIEEPTSSSTVLWVSGRPGVGKSALMQRIAELDGIYFGGCFFFRRGTPGCNVKDHLFSTLAYQLTTNVHGMVEHVDRAMIQDFSLPKRSATVQLKRLIIEPIRLLPIPVHSIIIIIDGLDECDGFDSQRDILTLIGQVAMDPSVAIRFIIASRPEHQICDMFNKEPLVSRTRHLVLDEAYDTAVDIERYLREKFEDIYSCNRDIMPDVKSPWPSKDNLETLVWRASGQFIYAATVIKFVDSDTDFRTPKEKLNIILDPSPIQVSAFWELDRLYTQILSQYPDSEVLVHILGVILVLEEGSIYTHLGEHVHSPATIATITGLGEANVHLALRALRSIIKIWTAPVFDDADDIEPNGTKIQSVKLCHRSFHDFLTDKARSGPYFIDTALFAGRVLCRILELATTFIKELKGCRSLLSPIDPYTWYQFQLFFGTARELKPSSKIELCLVLNKLRAVLFNDQPLLSRQLCEHFCASLRPTLHCICASLYFIRRKRLFDLPREDDPLHLDQIFIEARNLLDECFRQNTVGLSSIHLAFWIEGYVPRSLREIGDICNIPDRQRLRRIVDERSNLIHIHTMVEAKYVLRYSVPDWLRDFFFDPNRSRSLYSTSLVIDNCQKAIKSCILDPNPGFHKIRSLVYFFMPTLRKPSGEIPIDNIANATRLLESARSGTDRHELLLFLKYLSEIHWSDIYNRDWSGRHFTNGIMHWVCTTLESSSLEPGNIRDAMHVVFTKILLGGILPTVSQHISRASELGIFENHYCLGCLPQDIPDMLLDSNFDFEVLSRILPMLTSQNFFQTLCTRVVESVLLGMVWDLSILGCDFPSHTCGDGSTHSEDNSKIDPFDTPDWESDNLFYPRNRPNWSFAFLHASRSSKCIFVSIRYLIQLRTFFKYTRNTEWIVSEAINWLKNQTVDPEPQDKLIACVEDVNKKIERAMATQKQRNIDENLRRSAEWASVIQRSQTM